MENTSVEKFDPSKLMDGVRDRIKATFVSLIPDAQWEQMCDAEMKKFFEPIPVTGWNNKIESYKPSQFSVIVMELMNTQCREYIKSILAKPEYSMESIWTSSSSSSSGGKQITLSEHLDSMIKEKMPEMLQGMVTTVMSNAFYQFFSNIQQQVQNPTRQY